VGFLDAKTRILDTIITLQGRGQIAAGKLKAEFYSFTDMGAFYSQDTSLSASMDGTKRPFLEANSLPQDMITFEADDAGKLVTFPSNGSVVRNGQILLAVSSSSTGSSKVYLPAQDSIFASEADGLLSSSLDAYKNQYIISSPEIFDENQIVFALGASNIQFAISSLAPISVREQPVGNVETTDPLFVDSRLSHLPNFQYLPPINKYRHGDTTVNLLGNFPNLNQRPQLTFADVEREVAEATAKGYAVNISFHEISKTNNVICQMFEVGGNEIVKLDVIDFGLFNLAGDGITLSERKRQDKDPRNRPDLSKHVFFVGKVYTDSKGVHKFISLFTLVFEG